MKTSLRRTWLKLHRWTALGLGWLLGLAALLGAMLTVAKPLDRWAHPELFTQQTSARGPQLEAVLQKLRGEFGAQAGVTFRPPRMPEETLAVSVRGAEWEGRVYFDAAGQERGRRGEHEGFYNVLFELHSSLLLGDAGKAMLTAAAAAYLILLLTGLVLWWPTRWPPNLAVRWRSGWRKWTFDLHSIAGAVAGLLIAVSVATGAYMAWPPLRTWVSAVVAQTPAKPPRLPGTATGAAAGGPGVSLDKMVAIAQEGFPGATVGYVVVSPKQPVRVRLKLAGDPHPNGLTSVWLDPSNGRALATLRFDQLDTGHRIVTWVYPLHTGELGGAILVTAVGLGGLTLACLAISGLVLWWIRRKARVPRLAGHLVPK